MASVDAFWTFLTFVILAIFSGNTHSQELGFIQDLQDVIISKGHAFLWDCIPNPGSGGGPGQIVWKKNGQIMELDNRHKILNNGSLYFSTVRGKKTGFTDEGLYQCCVNKNLSGIIGTECSKKASLTVAAKPEITNQPENVLTRPGGVVRFYCGINAAPPATVRWQHGRTAIGDDEGSGDGDESKFTVLPGGALQIVDVTEQETGEYRCVVHNIAGQRQSQPATLSLDSSLQQPTDVVFIKSPEPIVRKRHTNAMMECLVDLPSSYSVAWVHRRQDGKLVSMSKNRASFIGQSNLILRDLSLDDSGLYYCRVLTPDDNLVTERSARLTVVAPPIIEQPPEESNNILGRTVRLRCNTFGVPKPKITWYKNGVPIALVGRFAMRDLGELAISSTQIKDIGIYQCFAENQVGGTQAAALVRFRIIPGRPSPPFDVQVVPSGPQTLRVTWRHSFVPSTEDFLDYIIHYQKTNAGKHLSALSRSPDSDDIGKLSPYTNYTIYITLFNSRGTSDPSEYVYAQTQPDKPSNVLKFSLASNSIGSLDVKWQEMPLEYANGEIIRYVIQYRQYDKKAFKEVIVNDGHQNRTVINDLQPGLEYEVRMLAATVVGNGPWSGWTRQRTLRSDASPGDITAPDMKTTFVNQSTILVEWQPVVGDIVGYKISYYTVDGLHLGPILLNANTTEYIITNLRPLTTCTVSLLAYNQKQDGSKTVQTITTYTASGLPWDHSVMPTPEHINVTAKSSTSVQLTWEWPFTNLEVTRYVIKYDFRRTLIFNDDDEQPQFAYHTPSRTGRQQRMTIDGLEPSTFYTFAVQAKGEDRVSSFSQHVNCQTPQNKPSSPPTNVNARPIDAHTVEMRWHPPIEPNGPILTYIIMYNMNESQPDDEWQKKEKTVPRQNSLLPQENLLTEINNLDSNTQYFFRMRARNNIGDSAPTKIVSVLTPIDVAPPTPIDSGGTDSVQFSETVLGILLAVGIVVVCIILCLLFLLAVRRYVNKHAQRYRESQAAANDILADRVRTYINQSNWPEGQGGPLDQFLPMLRQPSPPTHMDTKGSCDMAMGHLSPSTHSTPSTSGGHQNSHQYQRTSATSSDVVIETDIDQELDEHNNSFDSSLQMSSIKNMEGSSQDTGISTCHGEQDSPKSASTYTLPKRDWKNESSSSSSEISNQSGSSRSDTCTGDGEPSRPNVCPAIERTMFHCGGNYDNAAPRIFSMPHVREYTV